jgi:serine protease Do
LLEKRSVWGGLEGFFLDDALADLLNLPGRSSGYIVKTVAKDSPGDRIGLRGSRMIARIAGQEVPLGGDIILSVEGLSASPANFARIRDTLARLPAGTPFKMTILRAGEVLELTGRLE